MRAIEATTTCSDRASRLLRAWHHDASEFRGELDRTARFCRTSGDDSAAESERRELLEAIVEQMGRLRPQGMADPEAEVYFSLLEHLSRA